MQQAELTPQVKRWELYRVLSEPPRLRLLALAAEEELSVGELAELMGESQPNASRHIASLRRAGVLRMRKQGAKALVSVSGWMRDDPVVCDALATGRRLCEAEGTLSRLAELVRRRDLAAQAFFESQPREDDVGIAAELPAYLAALSFLLGRRQWAIDVGTGQGAVLDVLAPLFDRVLAVDRSENQLQRARRRVESRGYDNVEFALADLHDETLSQRVSQTGGADLVFAARILHHAPRPAAAFKTLASLVRPGGHLIMLDYHSHQDESLREQQADLWLGFEAQELAALAEQSGLLEVGLRRLPPGFCGEGPDGHLAWQALVAKRPD